MNPFLWILVQLAFEMYPVHKTRKIFLLVQIRCKGKVAWFMEDAFKRSIFFCHILR